MCTTKFSTITKYQSYDAAASDRPHASPFHGATMTTLSVVRAPTSEIEPLANSLIKAAP